MTSLTASTTWPPPTHSPWSGGSRLNCLPPLAVRWSRWLSPLKDVNSCGPPRMMLLGRATEALAAADAAPVVAPCWRARLRLGPRPRAAAAPRLAAPSGAHACGVSVGIGPRAPLPARVAGCFRPPDVRRPELDRGLSVTGGEGGSYPRRTLDPPDIRWTGLFTVSGFRSRVAR